MSQIECECGCVVDSRGYAAHRRGTMHDVNLCLKENAAEGRWPVASIYRNWLKNAGFPLISGPINWHPGGIKQCVKITYGYFVPRVIAGWIENTAVDAKTRQRALQAVKDLPDAARDELLAAAQSVQDLGGSVREFFQKIVVEKACDSPAV